ncbi:MAG: DUF1566 domain-containing protein [Desulfocapsaceae bacterium]|jgi:hypothetical protein|nr:DUF1566 domain-containing protein [Desulfocapsaceae bacterium]
MTTYPVHILSSGQKHCYDEDGKRVDCSGTGQDAEFMPGRSWPENRFEAIPGHLVKDTATSLIWTRNSCLSEFPLNWYESLDFIEAMNREEKYGRSDWRMPNRRELRSLIDHSMKKPALAAGHPFENLFLGWFWTSTTAAIATRYAWYVHFEGGRMFYGNKDSYCWFRPVCGPADMLACTGADRCYDHLGAVVTCSAESTEDGALRKGVPFPEHRFVRTETGIVDTLTGLVWHTEARHGDSVQTWQEALAAVKSHARETMLPWRMPTINELESLVDASRHSPALPSLHPFSNVQQAYWSSTTSGFETDWAYVLYLTKGAVGVGFKKNRDFALWPVMSAKTGLDENTGYR